MDLGPFFGGREPFSNFWGDEGRVGGHHPRSSIFDQMERMMTDFPTIADSMPSGGFEEDPRTTRSSRPGYYSTSYSSFSSVSGPGGRVYSKSISESHGPGGISERHITERDSAAELERMAVSRMLGERTRTIKKEKKGGEETTMDTLHNIDADDAERFDEEWTGAARHALSSYPGRDIGFRGGMGGLGSLDAGYSHWTNGDRRERPAIAPSRREIFEVPENEGGVQADGQDDQLSSWLGERRSRRRNAAPGLG